MQSQVQLSVLKEQNKTKDDESRLQTGVNTVETKLKSHWIHQWVLSNVKIELQLLKNRFAGFDGVETRLRFLPLVTSLMPYS